MLFNQNPAPDALALDAEPVDKSLLTKIFALLPCAGTGSRAVSDTATTVNSKPGLAKQYQLLAGQPLVMHTLVAFAQVTRLEATLLVLSPGDAVFQTLQAPPGVDTSRWQAVYGGGSTRAASVRCGLAALIDDWQAKPHDWVLVHDAARCLITPAAIDRLIDACASDEVGGLLAWPLADTLKQEATHSSGTEQAAVARSEQTLDRSGKWLAQTPQMFRIGILMQALDTADAAGQYVTDEASAIEQCGLQPRLVIGSAENFKITYPDDFALAEAVLQARQRRLGLARPLTQPPALIQKANAAPVFRIGEGWDTHALVPGRKLILGGVEIPDQRLGLLGHSDADVLLHAIIDALLGAAGLGDIGGHFSDKDARFKGADSYRLLQETGLKLAAGGWRIGNIDSTVIAQSPRLATHIPAMRSRIAEALALEVACVNVKAKTAEKLGPVGQGLAMEARAVALIMLSN